MAQSLSKFFAVWLGVLLAVGSALYFFTGDSGALDPSIEDSLLKACQTQSGGFSRDQSQQCLEQVPDTLLGKVLEVRSDLLYWFFLSALAVLVIGLIFIVRINHRSSRARTPDDFRSMRGEWYGHLLGIGIITVLFAVLAHFGSLFESWGIILTQSRGWGIPAALVVVWCLTFWLGSRWAAPTKMQPSIPGS